jgi:hypothetical protein
MKSLIKALAGIVLAGGQISKMYADGYIVPNGVTTNFLPGEISVMWNPTDSFYTGFLFQNAGGNLFGFDVVANVGVRVFFVSLNDPVSLGPILGHSYTELIPGSTYSFTSSSFYVGLYTGNDPSNPQPGGIYNDPLFGWARLRNNNGTIQLLDSALAYQSGGIIAGTQTLLPVPEPSVVALGVLGAAGMGYRRWRKRHNGF